jgi:hypothetical protein
MEKGVKVMINILITAAFVGVLVMKWNFFSKHYNAHK